MEFLVNENLKNVNLESKFFKFQNFQIKYITNFTHKFSSCSDLKVPRFCDASGFFCDLIIRVFENRLLEAAARGGEEKGAKRRGEERYC